MASPSSSQAVKLILAASNGRPITAYDALTGKVAAEFPASSTPRHGLAVVTAPDAPARVAASHVCPDTGTASARRSKGRARWRTWSRCCGSRSWAGTGPWS
ncbi:hypothetical protein ACP4OV_025486 [Aristida adscensionis]